VDRQAYLAQAFERQRPHLRAIAYRMLGSVSEAEDAIQEAWLRLARADPGGEDDLRGWLTVVVGRICLDMLRARRSRRESYAGTWLPEPIIGGGAPHAEAFGREAMGGEGDPEAQAVLADSVGLALLVVLETLTPPERLAFVLHDVFAISFDEIAPIVGRTPAAARQLASRARRRVQSAPRPDADLAVQRRVVDAFLAAGRAGDFEALIDVLDPHVVFRSDGGGVGPLARPPVEGAPAVARYIMTAGRGFARLARPAIVNGAAGVVVTLPGQGRYVIGLTVTSGRIAAIDINGDPAKLAGLDLDAG
jgi:RNA polymerase sigma-70 factor (ECF subfamily)